MKKIEAIIRTEKFEDVKKALANINVRFFTVKNVKGYGLQKGSTIMYRGANIGQGYIARIQMDILATSEKVDLIVETISKAGRTGEVGDGKIVVMELERVLRIRTGETDHDAI